MPLTNTWTLHEKEEKDETDLQAARLIAEGVPQNTADFQRLRGFFPF